jgi:hypothetical protein
LERKRDQRAESELGCDLLPVLEVVVREDVRHLDRATLARRFAARAEAESHARLAEPRAESLRPVVRGTESHELRCAVDEVDGCEGCPNERAHALERELIDLFGSIGGEERVDDLADRHELADCAVGCGRRGRTESFRSGDG